MADLDVPDPGAMAAVSAPAEEIEEVLAQTEGYVVLANVNSEHQVVLGGASEPVGRAVAAFEERGHQAIPLPVSHAFHTEIVAPVSEPLRSDAPPAAASRHRRSRSSPTSTASSTRAGRASRSRSSTSSAARSRRRSNS